MQLPAGTTATWTRLLPCLMGAVLALSLFGSRGVLAQGGADAERRLDSAARLLAGLAPTHAAHAELARSSAWQEHSRVLQGSWVKVRDGQLAALAAWRQAELPRGCPGGKTLLYPFSGPDFLNANALFPDCAFLVLFGLERVGAVPDIESMSPQEFARLLASVRTFMINLFARNYFVTSTMSRDLQAERLRGLVPVFMVLMALSGAEVLRIAPVAMPAAGPRPGPDDPLAAKAMRRELRGVSIEFRVAGSTQPRRLEYFSLDATNAGLSHYPEFLDYLRGLAPATTLLKAASYLLHGNEFTRVREAILDASRFIVQDDTGLPYGLLLKRGFQVSLYGRYAVPIKPFEYAYQPTLAAAYEKEKVKPLPFRFGYQRDGEEDRSNLMVARRPAGQARSGAEGFR